MRNGHLEAGTSQIGTQKNAPPRATVQAQAILYNGKNWALVAKRFRFISWPCYSRFLTSWSLTRLLSKVGWRVCLLGM